MKHKKLQKKPRDSTDCTLNQSDEHSRDCETPESIPEDSYFKHPNNLFPFSHFKSSAPSTTVPNDQANSEPEEEIDVVETADETTWRAID